MECETDDRGAIDSESGMSDEAGGGGCSEAGGGWSGTDEGGAEEGRANGEGGGGGEVVTLEYVNTHLKEGQYVKLRAPPYTGGYVTGHEHDVVRDRPVPFKLQVHFNGDDGSKAVYVSAVEPAVPPLRTRDRRRSKNEVAREEAAARARRGAEEERQRAAWNKGALDKVTEQVEAKKKEYSLLPPGRRIPARVLLAVAAMIRRGPSAKHGYATMEDVEALRLTDRELDGEPVEAGEAGEAAGRSGSARRSGAAGRSGRAGSRAAGRGSSEAAPAADQNADLEAELERAAVGAKVETGRMTEEEAEAHGAAFPMRSVNLEVDIPKRVVDEATSTIPDALRPKDDDTAEKLLDRIKGDSYLDWINGFYPKTFRTGIKQGLANFNTNPGSHQPKRRSESVVVEPERQFKPSPGRDGEGVGRWVWRLFNYTSFGRRFDDWRGVPMSWAWFVVGLFLWVACWPYLSPISRRSPPTHMQLLFYYYILKAAMGRHRDNSSAADIEKFINGEQLGTAGHASGGAENSQMIGSNVMVFTLAGHVPHDFHARLFPPKDDITRKNAITTFVVRETAVPDASRSGHHLHPRPGGRPHLYPRGDQI